MPPERNRESDHEFEIKAYGLAEDGGPIWNSGEVEVIKPNQQKDFASNTAPLNDTKNTPIIISATQD